MQIFVCCTCLNFENCSIVQEQTPSQCLTWQQNFGWFCFCLACQCPEMSLTSFKWQYLVKFPLQLIIKKFRTTHKQRLKTCKTFLVSCLAISLLYCDTICMRHFLVYYNLRFCMDKEKLVCERIRTTGRFYFMPGFLLWRLFKRPAVTLRNSSQD